MTMSNLEKNRIRTEQILLSLDKLDFLSRSQLQRMHNLKSDRNACKVLNNMSQYLNHFRDHENIFYLSKKGREKIGSNKVRYRNPQTTHTLMRNDLYIYNGQPNYWNNEMAITVGNFKIIPDAIYSKKVLDKNRYVLVEIDHSQKMVNNIKKLKRYKELKDFNAFQEQHGYFPIIQWLTTTEHRKKELLKHSLNLNVEIILWSDIK
ncbi:hypothetical protein BTS2_0519 [Bacillus sp. TS-2]|nr:hypothetical protein BTS2_0519 [Bacillus sp. TS-2]